MTDIPHRPHRTLRGDERGTSIITGYVLNMAVAALLIGFLIQSYTGFLGSATDNVQLNSYRVVANNLALKVTSFDRMVQSRFNTSMNISTLQTLVVVPRRVANSDYLITFTPQEIVVNRTGNTATRARIPLDAYSNITTRQLSSEQERITIYWNNATGGIDFQ